ncbi:divergent PAP2 family-domain-containing protein [Haematococcus lacustris]
MVGSLGRGGAFADNVDTSDVNGVPGSGFLGIFRNSPLLIAILCFAIAQSCKFVIVWIDTKQIHWERLVGSGGMPSAHSAFVTGLATSVGIREGTNSSVFAVAAVLALITMYDAVGLRLHSGRHASALNAIIAELPPDHPVGPGTFGQLREQLGHTPLQVAAGCLLGVVMAVVVQGSLGPLAHTPAQLLA